MKCLPKGRRLKRGDIVEVEWFDCHSSDRLSLEEINDLADPGVTIAFGIVLRNGVTYLTIASELGADPQTDGFWIEQVPHGSIKQIRLLGKRDIETVQP